MANNKIYLGYAVVAVLWLLPLLLVIFSRKTRGKEKLAWSVLTAGGGAFVYLAYLILAPVSEGN
ncbi:MAG: hypothetical protein HYV16_13250 [Gammaproteobacteria bacterium]|nr:hypothetical protein [Gammaproteobacteria bacterium]